MSYDKICQFIEH